MSSITKLLPTLIVLSTQASVRADNGPPNTVLPLPLTSADTNDEEHPDRIEIDDVDGTPKGYTIVQRRRRGLLLGGAVPFGIGYGAAILFGIGGDPLMLIPVAGPFAEAAWLKHKHEAAGEAAPFIIMSGASQVVGSVLLVAGLIWKKPVYIRNELVGTVSLSPLVSKGAQGLAVSGQF